MDEKRWFKNGLFTAIVILFCLIASFIVFCVCITLLTIYDGTTDNNFKNPMWIIAWVSGSFVLLCGLSAMAKRGWHFIQDVLDIIRQRKVYNKKE